MVRSNTSCFASVLLLIAAAQFASADQRQALDSMCKRVVWMSGIQVKDYTGTVSLYNHAAVKNSGLSWLPACIRVFQAAMAANAQPGGKRPTLSPLHCSVHRQA